MSFVVRRVSCKRHNVNEHATFVSVPESGKAYQRHRAVVLWKISSEYRNNNDVQQAVFMNSFHVFCFPPV